jgi:hypothetical protein
MNHTKQAQNKHTGEVVEYKGSANVTVLYSTVVVHILKHKDGKEERWNDELFRKHWILVD